MKTLKLTVYLWRDGADCFDSGCASERKLPGRGTLFNKSEDLPAALQQELRAAGLRSTND